MVQSSCVAISVHSPFSLRKEKQRAQRCCSPYWEKELHSDQKSWDRGTFTLAVILLQLSEGREREPMRENQLRTGKHNLPNYLLTSGSLNSHFPQCFVKKLAYPSWIRGASCQGWRQPKERGQRGHPAHPMAAWQQRTPAPPSPPAPEGPHHMQTLMGLSQRARHWHAVPFCNWAAIGIHPGWCISIEFTVLVQD